MDSNKYKKFGVDLKKIKNIHDSLPKFLNQTIKNTKSFNVLFKLLGSTHDPISLGRYNSTHKKVSII